MNDKADMCVMQSKADSDIEYKLTMYKDAGYTQQLTSFPASVSDKQILYVKAAVSTGFLPLYTAHLNTVVSRDRNIL